mmetsp:Transcript_19001/g.26822  ORF Transcript_19001/g.26822 Transcript_19001/m.26822 type:complete len:405 (+) Transcript_19001:101-1315(+)
MIKENLGQKTPFLQRLTVLLRVATLFSFIGVVLSFSNDVPGTRKNLKMWKLSTEGKQKKAITDAIPNKEPAGVESIFSILVSPVKTWHRQRYRKPRGNEAQSDSLSNIDSPTEDLEKYRKSISLPHGVVLDQEEEQNLAEMKYFLSHDLDTMKNESIQFDDGIQCNLVDAFPDVYGDFRLLRFLRKDKVQNPLSSSRRYQDFLKWRRTNDIDSIRKEVQQTPLQSMEGDFSPASRVLADLMPCDFRLDYLGGNDQTVTNVPLLLSVGQWDTGSVAKLISSGEVTLAQFLEYWTFIYESLHLKLYLEGEGQKKMVFVDVVCDFQNLSISQQFAPAFVSKVLKPWIKQTQENYPETSKRIIFVNPPRIISTAWAIIAPLMSPGTVEKVRFQHYQGSIYDFLKEEFL